MPIGVAAVVCSRLRLAESRGRAVRFDPVGVTLVIGGASALEWGVARANQAGWSSGEVVIALTTGALLVAGFLAWELRVAEPMLPLRLFANRTFAAANATGFLMTASIFSAAFLMSQYFQVALGYSPLATGLRFLPWTATPMVAAPLAGLIADRIGARPLMITGMLLQGLGLTSVALLSAKGPGYAALVLPLVIAEIGVSMAIPTTAAAVMSSVAPSDMGRASGANRPVPQRFPWRARPAPWECVVGARRTRLLWPTPPRRCEHDGPRPPKPWPLTRIPLTGMLHGPTGEGGLFMPTRCAGVAGGSNGVSSPDHAWAGAGCLHRGRPFVAEVARRLPVDGRSPNRGTPPWRSARPGVRRSSRSPTDEGPRCGDTVERDK